VKDIVDELAEVAEWLEENWPFPDAAIVRGLSSLVEWLREALSGMGDENGVRAMSVQWGIFAEAMRQWIDTDLAPEKYKTLDRDVWSDQGATTTYSAQFSMLKSQAEQGVLWAEVIETQLEAHAKALHSFDWTFFWACVGAILALTNLVAALFFPPMLVLAIPAAVAAGAAFWCLFTQPFPVIEPKSTGAWPLPSFM
jgi:hypothetical protein